MAGKVQKERAQATVRRIQKAVSDGKYDQAEQIINALDEEQAKYLALALSLAMFEAI